MTQLDLEYAAGPGAPIDMLEHVFGSNGWAFERDGDEEISAEVKGGWTTYQLRALWRADEGVLQFIAMPELTVPPARRLAMYETLNRVNERLWIGHFEIGSNDGALFFRHATLLDEDDEDEVDLTAAHAAMLVEAALEECERYHPVFRFVAEGDKTPEEALAAALLEVEGEA